MATSDKPTKEKKDTSKVHKLSLKGSAKLVAEFVRFLPTLYLSLSSGYQIAVIQHGIPRLTIRQS